MFEGKDLSLEGNKGEDLKQAISEEINSKNEAYQKRSNALGHIRERIDKSIEIYSDYVS